jgi:DNA-binding response OmpR family regulator
MDSYRVLVIEDNPAIGQSLLDGLEHHGFSVDLRTTGSGGIEFTKRHVPHLIILDIRLPDGSGFDFCRQMRKSGPINRLSC